MHGSRLSAPVGELPRRCPSPLPYTWPAVRSFACNDARIVKRRSSMALRFRRGRGCRSIIPPLTLDAVAVLRSARVQTPEREEGDVSAKCAMPFFQGAWRWSPSRQRCDRKACKRARQPRPGGQPVSLSPGSHVSVAACTGLRRSSVGISPRQPCRLRLSESLDGSTVPASVAVTSLPPHARMCMRPGRNDSCVLLKKDTTTP
jgi:hypothetical protein